MSKRVICTVTNDLSHDQRMQRICASLSENGCEVLLIGRALPNSKPLENQNFKQLRLPNIFRKGFLFYAEHNLRLFIYLLFARYDVLCSVDLDTIAGGGIAAILRGKRRVFDAHEYFTEVPEVVHRRAVRLLWSFIERIFVPHYHLHYTVGDALADIFTRRIGKKFHTIRNVPRSIPTVFSENEEQLARNPPKILLYQGALNAGRGLEVAIEAIEYLPDNILLWIAGEGDLSETLRKKAAQSLAAPRIVFLGFQSPAALRVLTQKAWLGLNLLENSGKSYYFSLANKFFDYIQAEVPGITMDFPEYRKLVAEHPVAILLPELSTESLVSVLLPLLEQPEKYAALQAACRTARKVWTWENESKKLWTIWKTVVN